MQIKIKNFLDNIHKLKNNITLISIQSDNKQLFKKLREKWNRIIKIIGINNAKVFVKNTIDDDADEFTMVDVQKNTSFVRDNNIDKLIIVLHSVIDNNLKASLVQAKTLFSYLPIFNKFKT